MEINYQALKIFNFLSIRLLLILWHFENGPYDIQNVDIDFFCHNFLFWAKFAEKALYVYKPTIRPYMEYCHVWAGARTCYLKLLDKLQRKICGTVGTSFAALLNPWLIVEMWSAWVFSIGITLVDVHQNRLNLFHSFVGGLLVILIDLMIFLLLFFDVTRMSMRTVFFLSAYRILCLWNAFL